MWHCGSDCLYTDYIFISSSIRASGCTSSKIPLGALLRGSSLISRQPRGGGGVVRATRCS